MARPCSQRRIASPQAMGADLPVAIFRPECCGELNLTLDQERQLRDLTDRLNRELPYLQYPLDLPERLTPVFGVLGKRLGGLGGCQMFEELRSRGDIPIDFFKHGWLSSEKAVIITSGHNNEGRQVADHIGEKARHCLIDLPVDRLRVGDGAKNTTENFQEISHLIAGKDLNGNQRYQPIQGPLLSFIATTEYHARRLLLEDQILQKETGLKPLLSQGPVVFLMTPNPYQASDDPGIRWMVDVNQCLHLVSALQVNLYAIIGGSMTGINPLALNWFELMNECLFDRIFNDSRVSLILGRVTRCPNRVRNIKGAIGVVATDLTMMGSFLRSLSELPSTEQCELVQQHGQQLLKAIGMLIEYVRWRSDPEAVEYEEAAPPPMDKIKNVLSLLPEKI